VIETLRGLAGPGFGDMWSPPAQRDQVPSAQPGASLENPRTSWDRIFEVERSYSGKNVTEMSALQSAAVWRCVAIISGTLARTPFSPYQRIASGKKLARDHYLWPVFNREANPFMSSYRWKRLMQTHTCIWGNGYSWIDINGRGQVQNLWPLRPDRMRPKVATGQRGQTTGVIYEYRTLDGRIERFGSWEILHLRGLETDGLEGLGPIRSARQSVGLLQAAEEYGGRYFDQGVHIGGWVSHPQALSKEAKKNIAETLNDLYGGLQGAHRLGVLEEGMQYHAVGIPPEDMQFLQTRQFQVIDIARLFGVPPHMVAELSRATFSNIEHQAIEFNETCMADWFENWKAECTAQLLSEREQASIELAWYTANLTRGDKLTRYQAYNIGRLGGWLTPNMILEAEGENLIEEPWGDEYLQPLNVVVAGEGSPDSEDPEVIDDEEDLVEGGGPVPGTSPLKPKAKQSTPMPPGVAPLKPKAKKSVRYMLVPMHEGGDHARDRAAQHADQ